MTIDELAQAIRKINGFSSMGAGQLAEALNPSIDVAFLEFDHRKSMDEGRLTALRAEVEALRLDKKRMDWLVENTWVGTNRDGYMYWGVRSLYAKGNESFTSAIDAAIARVRRMMTLSEVSAKLKSHADFMGSLGGSGDLMDSVELAACADAIDSHLTSREAKGDADAFAIEAVANDYITEGTEGESGTAYVDDTAKWFLIDFVNGLPSLYTHPATQEAAKPVVPEGYVLVPVEPSEWDVDRGVQAWEDELDSWVSIGGTLDRKEVVHSIYRAMTAKEKAK